MSDVSKLVTDFLSGKASTTDGPMSSANSEDVVRADASQESEALEDYGTAHKDSDSTDEDLLPGSGDTPTDSGKKANAKAGSNSQTSDKEIITVTDEQGIKRKVEIDYSNKESIKKAFLMQNGARKWQAERDKALESKKTLDSELSTLKQDFAALDDAFKKGHSHLVDRLYGPGAWEKAVAKEVERREFLKTASPEEVRAFEAEEKAQRQAKDFEALRKENEEFKKQMNETKDQAEERALESKIHPSFEKYRFADKLGNTSHEHRLDKMLWLEAMESLEQHEEKGVTLTPELIDKEFRAAAKSVRDIIGNQAEKKATKVVENKKREATENVQAKVMSGYKTGGHAQEARDLMNKGDLTSLLKGWNKYGNLFNKK